MEKSLNTNFFRKPLVWIFIVGMSAFGITFSTIFHFSFFLPAASIIIVLSCVLLIREPLLLLSLLIVVRMSLDYSAQYFTFTFFDIPLSLSQLLGIGIALLGAIILFLKREKLLRFPLAIPFLIIFLWGSATLAASLSPRATLQELLRFFDIFALSFFAYATIEKTDDFRKLLVAFFASSVIPILFALYQFTFSIGFQDEAVSIPRIFGTFSHPNVFSLYLFTLIVFALLHFFIFSESHYKRIFTFLVLGILTLTLLLTFARVAWVTLFVFALFLALFRYRMLLFPLIFFPLILFVFSQTFQDRVLESFHPGPDSSILWRQNLWHDVTTKSIQDGNYWFGSGMDTFPIMSESLRGIYLGSNDPHNDFVKFFVEGGVVGVVIYVLYLTSILFILIKNYLRSHPKSALQLSFGMLILFFIALMLASLTDNVFKNTPVQWLFFIALGGLLALVEKRKSSLQ